MRATIQTELLLETLQATRDLGRMHDIATVLVRHGLGEAVRRLGLAGALERAGRALHWSGAAGLERDPAVRLREAFEELGPTFVKLGQLLAGRGDLLPPAWTDELSRLHERARPLAFDELRPQLREDLGAEPEALFRDFDPEPLAAASIAQVHRARLEDGTPVALKIRRPGIRELVEADLRLLARLAEAAEEHLPELRRLRPQRLVRQFARHLHDELDLRVEARNAERLREGLDPSAPVVLPRIHHDWTRERLCVMDLLSGQSVGAWLRAGRPGPLDPGQVAALGAETVLRSVFVAGCFHGDPHPGNVLLLDDGRLGLVDFGLVGVLSEARRIEFLGLLLAVVERDAEEVVATLAEWSEGELDLELLKQDCAAFIDHYHGVPLGRLDLGELLRELYALLRENRLYLPGDVTLLLKVFVTLEGLGRQLDPHFEMARFVEPFARASWREQHSPAALLRRGGRGLRALLSELPRDLRLLGALARGGRVHLQVDLEQLDRLARRLDRSATRLTLGLVTSALIVGTAVCMNVAVGPRLAGLPLFAALGFASSIAVGLVLAWSIAGSSRRE